MAFPVWNVSGVNFKIKSGNAITGVSSGFIMLREKKKLRKLKLSPDNVTGIMQCYMIQWQKKKKIKFIIVFCQLTTGKDLNQYWFKFVKKTIVIQSLFEIENLKLMLFLWHEKSRYYTFTFIVFASIRLRILTQSHSKNV